MSQLITNLEKAGVTVPVELLDVLNSCKNYTVFNSVEELRIAALGGSDNNSYEVKYDVHPEKQLLTDFH